MVEPTTQRNNASSKRLIFFSFPACPGKYVLSALNPATRLQPWRECLLSRSLRDAIVSMWTTRSGNIQQCTTWSPSGHIKLSKARPSDCRSRSSRGYRTCRCMRERVPNVLSHDQQPSRRSEAVLQLHVDSNTRRLYNSRDFHVACMRYSKSFPSDQHNYQLVA